MKACERWNPDGTCWIVNCGANPTMWLVDTVTQVWYAVCKNHEHLRSEIFDIKPMEVIEDEEESLWG